MDLKENKKNIQKNKKFRYSFKYASAGLKIAFKEERNFRSHFILGIGAIVFGVFFKLAWNEWLWIALAVFLVVSMELLNTMAENLVDMITEKTYDVTGKKVKDIGAAIVLLSAILSLVIASVIFGPKIWQLLINSFRK